MRFNVGDIVRISRGCIFYGVGMCNPKDTNGRIRFVGDFDVRVEWDNGQTNGYGEHDLKLVRRRDAV